MAATWASSSDPGNVWMRQLTTPVRPEADKGAWPETVADGRTALPCWPAQWPYSLELGSCRCCLLTLLACGRKCTLKLCLEAWKACLSPLQMLVFSIPKASKHRRKQFLGLPCANPTSKRLAVHMT